MPIISLEEFEMLCLRGHRYEGYVQGLGYVYWKPHYTKSTLSGMPSQTPYNTPQNSMFTIVFYEMVVMLENDKHAQDEKKKLNHLGKIGTIGVSLYSIAKTYQSMSTTLVTVGNEYNINAKGQITRNYNRNYTNKGALAKTIGKRLWIVGIVIDTSLLALGAQNLEQTATSIVVNTGIFVIGVYISAPLAVALGITWLITGLGGAPENHTSIPYEEIHGFAPQDNTRVAIPDYNMINYVNLMNYLNSTQLPHETKQYSFEQGHK
jgi:hypothetical protein